MYNAAPKGTLRKHPVMNDKSDLLGQLKIDRSGTPVREPNKWVWLGPLLAVVVTGIGYVAFKPSDAIPVRAVGVKPLASAGAPVAASVLDASGYVVARRQATVSSKVTGKVLEVLIEEGQHVKEGQVLARIDDSNSRAQLALSQSQLDAARSTLAEVKVQLADAERQLVRTRELADKKLVSQAALDTAQANLDALRARLGSTESNVGVAGRGVEVQSRLLDDTVVRAPFAGVITQKNAQPGEMISPLSAGGAGTRTGIGTLVDMDSLEVEVDVNENFIGRVQSGQPASAKLNAYPDWEIPAEVIAVIPTADRSKATVKVRIGFKVKDVRILPDMGVRVSFHEQAKPAETGAAQPVATGVLAPTEAVQVQGDTGVVWVLSGDKVERRAVKLGGNRSDGVAVIAGLRGMEQLAVGDFAKLTDGAKVKVQE